MKSICSKFLVIFFSLSLINCSDVEFAAMSGPINEGIKHNDDTRDRDNVQDSTDLGDRIWDIINENDGIETIGELDSTVHKKIQDCLPMVRGQSESQQSLSGSENMSIIGKVGPMSYMLPINRLEILSSVGSLAIHLANVLTEAKGQRGPASVRAREVLSWSDSTGPLNLSTSKIEQIENVTGPVCLGSQTIGTVNNLTGPLIVIGPSTGLLIHKISKARGPLLLFNAKVDAIEDHVGPIVLYNSSYGSISNVGPVVHKVQ